MTYGPLTNVFTLLLLYRFDVRLNWYPNLYDPEVRDKGEGQSGIKVKVILNTPYATARDL